MSGGAIDIPSAAERAARSTRSERGRGAARRKPKALELRDLTGASRDGVQTAYRGPPRMYALRRRQVRHQNPAEVRNHVRNRPVSNLTDFNKKVLRSNGATGAAEPESA